MSGTEVQNLGGAALAETKGKQPTEIERFKDMLGTQRQAIQKVLPGHVAFDKFQSVVLTAVLTNPDLLTANRHSLVLACIKSATDGLLPDGREAALVIFNENKKGDDGTWKKIARVQYMPMYAGILKKVRQSGQLASIKTAIVYTADKFEYFLGDEDRIEHQPYIGPDPRGPIRAVYAIAKLTDGTVVREVMAFQDIEKIRKASKAGAKTQYDVDKKGGKVGDPKGIWEAWYEEMARKTVFRRLSKWLPQSVDFMDRVFENDETMEVFKIEADPDQTIEHDDDGVIEGDTQASLTDQTGQPDLSAEIEKANAKDAQKEPVPTSKQEAKAEPKPKKEKQVKADPGPEVAPPPGEKPFPGDPAVAPAKVDTLLVPEGTAPYHAQLARRMLSYFAGATSPGDLHAIIAEDFKGEMEKLFSGNKDMHVQIMAEYDKRLAELEGQS